MTTRSFLIVHSGYPEAMSFFMPDNGLASLAACLLDAGHHTEIIDFNTPQTMRQLVRPDRPRGLADLIRANRFDALRSVLAEDERHYLEVFERTAEQVARRVRTERVDWVGFKLWSGDSLYASDAMARRIKAQCPGTITLVGGPQVDRLGELILNEFPAFDAAAVGEGEPCVVEFAERVGRGRSLADVPNLLIRQAQGILRTQRAGVEDLDALPLPRYDEATYPAMAGQKLRVLSFEESRGCRNRCTFCTHRSKAGALRVRRPRLAVSALRKQLAEARCVAFRLCGSFTPSSVLQELAEELTAQRLEYPWNAFGHVRDSMDVDFSAVRASGCVTLLFGVESGSQRILDDVIDKGVAVEDIHGTLVAVRKAGIKAIASLIYPNHTESGESRQQTLDLLEQTGPFGASILFPGLFPGSRWWGNPSRFGFGIADRDTYLRSLLSFKIRLFYPIELWNLVDVTLDGKRPEQVVRECLDFTAAVRRLGIHSPMADETLLFGRLLGADVLALRERTLQAFVGSDVDDVEAIIEGIHGGGGPFGSRRSL